MLELLRGEYWLLGFVVGLCLIVMRPQFKKRVIAIPDPSQESQWQFRDVSGGLFEIQSRPVMCRFTTPVVEAKPQT